MLVANGAFAIRFANGAFAIRLVQWLGWVFETQKRKKVTCDMKRETKTWY